MTQQAITNTKLQVLRWIMLRAVLGYSKSDEIALFEEAISGYK